MREVDRQRPWFINAWAGILNDKIIDPHFIDRLLNSLLQVCTDFNRNIATIIRSSTERTTINVVPAK